MLKISIFIIITTSIQFYVDDILERLKDSGIRCHIEYIYVGALGYANDLIQLQAKSYDKKYMNSMQMKMIYF